MTNLIIISVGFLLIMVALDKLCGGPDSTGDTTDAPAESDESWAYFDDGDGMLTKHPVKNKKCSI